MQNRLFVILLIALLAACTPVTPTDPSQPTSVVATPTREGDLGDDGIDVVGDPGSGFGLGDLNDGTGFVAVIDGAESIDVLGEGTINCENDVYVIRATLDSFPQISLILPAGASPGNYTLEDNRGDGTTASATVFFEDSRVFAANVEGILIINDLATQAGQTVSGSFDFSVSSDSQTINARGEFDFTSSEAAVYCS